MGNYINNLVSFLSQYENKTTDELLKELNIITSAKSKNYVLSQALIYSFEGKGIAQAKIERDRINIKTIQLKENGCPKEAMSFSPINYCKIVDETWNSSEFRDYLDRDFIFFIFKNEGVHNYLIKVVNWRIPLSDLDGEVKLVWEDTKSKIKEGRVFKEKKDEKLITYFLSEKITNICHVRPHGSNSADVIKLPVKDLYTGYNYAIKQSFWFNHSYLKKIVGDNLEVK